jgi:signal transduction histidine kinase
MLAMPLSTPTMRRIPIGVRMLWAALILDVAELVLCGGPLVLWMPWITWGTVWLKLTLPLLLALWLAASLRMTSQLRPLWEFLRATSRGEKPKLLDAGSTKKVLARGPREEALIHLLGWMAVTLFLVYGAVRENARDTVSGLAVGQLVLFSSVGLAALRMLVFEVLFAPIRPLLLPSLQGLWLFANRYQGALISLGIAALGLAQSGLALFALSYGPITGKDLTFAFFIWWAMWVPAAFIWWKTLRSGSAPIAAYLDLSLNTKGNRNVPRDEPKAVAAFVATTSLTYRLSQVGLTGVMLASLVTLFLLTLKTNIAPIEVIRLGVVVVFVSLVVTIYHLFLTQQLLRPLLRHLGSRHLLPISQVRSPIGLGKKLICIWLTALGLGGGVVWLHLTAPKSPILGWWTLFLAAAPLIGMVLFILRDTVAPLYELEERSGEMATGQLARPVPPWGEADEIGRLALIFEEMRRSLRDRLRSTESINVDLEREVRRRTESLEERNAELHEALDKLRRAQDNLVRSEKLASMGRLVAGIAHEINNPVNAVINSLAPLGEIITRMGTGAYGQEAIKVAQEANEILAVVDRGAARTKAIVQALHGYARGDEKVQRDVFLVRSVDETLGLLAHRIRHIAVERSIHSNVRIQGFPGQIDQVIMNLIINATQAMGVQGGTIRIAAETLDTNVLLTVEDTGPGISPEILPRIFDPFFTTKDVGEGSGLGLSIVHGIVDRHGGRIEVTSEPGKGTKFSLFFPLPPPRTEGTKLG